MKQLVKKRSCIYQIIMFSTVFTKAHCWSIPWASSIFFIYRDQAYLIIKISVIYDGVFNDEYCTLWFTSIHSQRVRMMHLLTVYGAGSIIALYSEYDAYKEMSLRENFSNDNCYFPTARSCTLALSRFFFMQIHKRRSYFYIIPLHHYSSLTPLQIFICFDTFKRSHK